MSQQMETAHPHERIVWKWPSVIALVLGWPIWGLGFAVVTNHPIGYLLVGLGFVLIIYGGRRFVHDRDAHMESVGLDPITQALVRAESERQERLHVARRMYFDTLSPHARQMLEDTPDFVDPGLIQHTKQHYWWLAVPFLAGLLLAAICTTAAWYTVPEVHLFVAFFFICCGMSWTMVRAVALDAWRLAATALAQGAYGQRELAKKSG